MDGADPDDRLASLYRRHFSEVHAYCARRMGASEADDAVAKVFAVAWRRIDEIDWATARPWLYGIARRVLANRWRSMRRRSCLAERLSSLVPGEVETPEIYVIQTEKDREAIDALKTLQKSDQEILMLSAWEGLSAPDIAKALGISVSAAEQRLHRAKRRYAGALDPPQHNSQLSPRAAQNRGGR